MRKLLILIIVTMVFFGAMPVSAQTAPVVTGRVIVRGGAATYSVQRLGWRVRYFIQVTDTLSDGRCAYARLELNVDQGPNPVVRAPDVCGFGSTKNFNGYLTPGKLGGYSIDTIEVKICINRKNFQSDDCGRHSMPVLQHRPGSLTSTQLATLDRLSIVALPTFMFYKSQNYLSSIFDWRDDGCSARIFSIPVAPIMSQVFRKACIRHDFGYRNFGKKYYRHTDSQRKKIDDIFYYDMTMLCRNPINIGLAGGYGNCMSSAARFYNGVRQLGGRHFAGQ